MGYVEQVVQGEAGLQIYVEQVEQGEGGLKIVVEQVEQGQGVCPAEPLHLFQSGSTKPWKIWSQDGPRFKRSDFTGPRFSRPNL